MNLLQTLKDLESKATKGPWKRLPILKSNHPEKYNEVARIRGVRIYGEYGAVSCGDETDFILASRNALPKLLNALEIAIETLEKFDHEDLYGAYHKDYFDKNIAKEALTEINKLLKGDEDDKN